MKTVERKLFHENWELFNEISRDLNEMKPLLYNVRETYEALNIGVLSNEVFKKIIGTGGPTKVRELFNQSLNNQLDEMKMTSKIMREKMIDDHSYLIDDFDKSVNILKVFKPNDVKTSVVERKVYLKPNHVSIVESQFVVSVDDKENILENYCRTYIANEEIEFLEKLQKLVTTYIDLKEFMITNSFSSGFIFSTLSHFIIEGDRDGSSINKSCNVEINKNVFIGAINFAKCMKNNS